MEVFEKELKWIKSEPIRKLVEVTLEELTNFNGKEFFKAPASKTGRHHPKCSNVQGGLIRHTKRAAAVAEHLCRAMAFTDAQKDIVIASVILHDIRKDDYRHHAESAVTFIAKVLSEYDDLAGQIGMDAILKITGCIGHHMGPWTHHSIKKQMSEYSQEELITYLSDYLSSCKDVVTSEDDCDLSSLEDLVK